MNTERLSLFDQFRRRLSRLLTPQEENMNIGKGRRIVVSGVATLAVLVALLVPLAVGYGLEVIPDTYEDSPEIILPLLVIFGVAGLLASLIIAAIVFSALGLSEPGQALSLPQGSIRALIALILLLIFAIMAMFLYRQLRTPPTTESITITKEQLAAIPAEEIFSSVPSEAGENLFDVRLRLEGVDASEDFAKQVLTTASTLVVAIAGFYFGAKAVAVARGAVEPPALRVLSPPSPTKLAKTKGKKLALIKVETTPRGEAITWRIKEGDDDGSLFQVKPYELEYTRGSSPASIVTLEFALVNHPDVTAELKVEVEKESSGT